MAYRVKKYYILLPLLFVLSTYVAVFVAGRNYTDECPEMRCKPDGPRVRFPFRIIGKHVRDCGYEGFEIYCSSINDSILHLPDGSANLSVTRIDYRLQQLYVRDEPASSCLPKKNNSYNLSSSPFQFNPDNYNTTLFNCSIKSWENNMYSIRNCPNGPQASLCDYLREKGSLDDEGWCNNSPWPVYCPDNVDQRYKVIALRNDLSPCFLARVTSCPKLYEAAVTYYRYYKGYAQPDVILSWSTPDCRSCEEEEDGTCIPKKTNSSQPQVDCLLQQYIPIPNNKGILKKTIVSVVVIGSFLLLVVAIVLYVRLSSDKVEKENQVTIKKFLEDYKALKPSRYSYALIKRITNEFKDQLGQGAYGTVFKGMLSNEIAVAVKILNTSKGEGEEFVNEVGTIGKIHHVNVVRLVGFCADGLKRALVYEYLPNGSLEKFVTSSIDKSKFLGWKKLHEISLGIAKGIEYLHQGCDQRILHFDIKPRNILLDQNFSPKISDFGLAKLCSKDQSIVSMTTARGTIGYIAPEVFSRNFGNVSYKSDVYSFGMLLLEMVGGRKIVNLKATDTDEVYYPEWIYNLLEKEDDLRIEIEEEGDTKIAKKLAIVGLKCIQWHPVDRPSMKKVVLMLEGEEDSDLSLPSNPFTSTDARQTHVSITARNIRVRELGAICESFEQEIEEVSEFE